MKSHRSPILKMTHWKDLNQHIKKKTIRVILCKLYLVKKCILAILISSTKSDEPIYCATTSENIFDFTIQSFDRISSSVSGDKLKVFMTAIEIKRILIVFVHRSKKVNKLTRE